MPEVSFERTFLTLAASDQAMVADQEVGQGYFGCGSVGDECSRRIWYAFRWAKNIKFSASTLKKFEDGHLQEEVMFKRLSKVAVIKDRQFRIELLNGLLNGHVDGVISGLLESKEDHIWEHKSVDEKYFKKLLKLLNTMPDEHDVLKEWNPKYYVQAQLYMYGMHLKRHFLTVSTPGGRDALSVRTPYSKEIALETESKVESIIKSDEPPPRIGVDREFWICRMCDYKHFCYPESAEEILKDPPVKSCRTCVHVDTKASPTNNGIRCARTPLEKAFILTKEEQKKACSEHLFNFKILNNCAPQYDGKDVIYTIGDRSIKNKKGTGVMKWEK